MDNNPNIIRDIKLLLENDAFVESVLSPTPENEEYWNTLVEKGSIDKAAFDQARNFILTIRDIPSPEVSESKLNMLWKRINATNRRNTMRMRRNVFLRIGSSVAAVVAVAMVVYSVLNRTNDTGTSINGVNLDRIAFIPMSSHINLATSNQQLALPGNEATIDYSDAEIKVNSESIAQTPIDDDGFNQLVVPAGKRSQIILPDSSLLWVNSGTRVIYPSRFSGKTREIYVEGEIYADVRTNAKCPFIVKTPKMSVRVLGTQFNVSAYKDDWVQSVVLVEGRVDVESDGAKPARLMPNQMYSTNGQNQCIETVDVDQYVSWKDGRYNFKQEKISEILARLARYCGVEILCPADVGVLTCSGTLLLRENVEQLLDGLCRTAPVAYRKDGNTYIFYLKP